MPQGLYNQPARGLGRIREMIARDYKGFWMAGLVNLLLLAPWLWGVGYAQATHSVLFALLAGSIGGVVAAPGFYGLADTLLRSLRDEPGFWWHRYHRAVKANWKQTLLPGALMGTAAALAYFTLVHLPVLGGGLGLLLCQGLCLVVLTGLFLWALAQQVLMELSFAAWMKNSVLLFFRFFGKTLQASLLFLGFCLGMGLLLPASVFLLLVVGLWLPLLLAFSCLYPSLEEVFHISSSLTNSHSP